MDSGYEHDFQFDGAISFIVYCKDQDEIDYFWKKLSAVPEEEQCGWLKDKYGISWQIVPEELSNMMDEGGDAQRKAVTAALMNMKKIEIDVLKKAFKEAT